jgi:hypothetical protein
MRDLRNYTPSDIAALWLAGLALAVVLLVAGWLVPRHIVRRDMSRYAVGAAAYTARDRQIAADYAAYANAHPADSAAQRKAREKTAEMNRQLRTDSMLVSLKARGRLGDPPGPEENQARAGFRKLVVLLLSYLALCVGLIIPPTLAGFTIWWAVARRRAG